MRSRTDGAPSLPIASDEDLTPEELEAARAFLNEDMLAAAMAAVGQRMPAAPPPSSAPSGPPPVSPAEAARRASFDGWLQNAERDLAERRAGPQPMPAAAPRERPRSRLQQEGIDFADSRQFGSRYGGGEPFRSKAEADEYSTRRLLTEDEKEALRSQGKSEQEIMDMQRSEFDRAAAQVGFSGGSGWVPVYTPQGTVTYLERAYLPNVDPGATDVAVGGQRRVGKRVDSGQVRDTLERPDLVRRGYTAEQRHGPYGVEVVWVKTGLGEDELARMRRENPDLKLKTREDFQAEGLAGADLTNALRQQMESVYEARRGERIMRGLRTRAGLTAAQAEGKSAQDLRDLIAETRAAALRERNEVSRRARMAPRVRNELAFREMGMPDANEWQNAVAAQRLAPELRGMTPTMREAMSMQRAFDLANAALRGGGENPLGIQREMATENWMREGRKIAAEYIRDTPGTAAAARARADRALYAKGYSDKEREEILNDFPMSVPAAGGGAAEPPDPLGHMN